MRGFPARSVRILVVDDDASVREALAIFFATEFPAADTLQAPDGITALTLLQSERFDVVVADVNMPGLDGIHLLAWLAKNKPGVGRVVITGSEESAVVADAVSQARVHDFVRKPLDPAALSTTVRRLVDRSRHGPGLREVVPLWDGDLSPG